jgi:hypothetical protein
MKRKEIELFGLSFLDLICCGLGGAMLLLIMFAAQVQPAGGADGAGTSAGGGDADERYCLQIACEGDRGALKVRGLRHPTIRTLAVGQGTRFVVRWSGADLLDAVQRFEFDASPRAGTNALSVADRSHDTSIAVRYDPQRSDSYQCELICDDGTRRTMEGVAPLAVPPALLRPFDDAFRDCLWRVSRLRAAGEPCRSLSLSEREGERPECSAVVASPSGVDETMISHSLCLGAALDGAYGPTECAGPTK